MTKLSPSGANTRQCLWAERRSARRLGWSNESQCQSPTCTVAGPVAARTCTISALNTAPCAASSPPRSTTARCRFPAYSRSSGGIVVCPVNATRVRARARVRSERDDAHPRPVLGPAGLRAVRPSQIARFACSGRRLLFSSMAAISMGIIVRLAMRRRCRGRHARGSYAQVLSTRALSAYCTQLAFFAKSQHAAAAPLAPFPIAFPGPAIPPLPSVPPMKPLEVGGVVGAVT